MAHLKNTYPPELRPTDVALLERYKDEFSRHGWNGAPIVVLTDLKSRIQLILSDPHRHAAAEALHLEWHYVRIQDVFTEAGFDYYEIIRELAGMAGDRALLPRKSGEYATLRPATLFWWDMAVRSTLPTDIIRKYWTEQGDGSIPGPTAL